jgi:hypothetical protein
LIRRREFGYSTFAQSHYAEMQAWLTPIALTTTSGLAVARALLEELRRRRIAAPGETVTERLVGAAMLQADRHVAKQLAGSLSSQQLAAADKLLDLRDGTNLSEFARARLPPGVVGHRSLTRLIEQVQLLPAIADPTTSAASSKSAFPHIPNRDRKSRLRMHPFFESTLTIESRSATRVQITDCAHACWHIYGQLRVQGQIAGEPVLL